MTIFTGVWKRFGVNIDLFERAKIDNATKFSFFTFLFVRY